MIHVPTNLMTMIPIPSIRVLATALLLIPVFGAIHGPSVDDEGKPTAVIETAAGGLERRLVATLEMGNLNESGAALIRFEGLKVPSAEEASADSVRVDLVGGGRVFARFIDGLDEALNLRLQGGTRLQLGIEEFVSLRFTERFPEAWTEPVVAALDGDRLYRVRGTGVDRIDGTVETFTDQGVSMETGLGTKTFPWREVGALFIEELGDEDEARNEGQAVIVDLIDGSRLPLTFLRLGATGLELQTAAGGGLRLPLSVVAEILVVGSGIEFLSELEPKLSEVTSPFGDDLGMVWPARRDLSASGGLLRAGGHVWTRGLGVHAPSRLEFALDSSWKGLRGWVAIDDEVIPLPASGSVQFRVKSGDELLWQSPVLRGGDEPLALPEISLEGVDTLVLEVDMADELHVGDRADWLRMILSR
ncbi:MAG: hypothetical protein ACI8X5_002385 [Planctomycetota bacterium]|jgi:hypothetical protein